MTKPYRTIDLPEDLCAEAEKWMGGRFDSVASLLGFMLEEIVKSDGSKLDEAEEEIIEQRLKDLGYI